MATLSTLAIRMTPDFRRRVDAAAAASGLTRTGVVCLALDYWLAGESARPATPPPLIPLDLNAVAARVARQKQGGQ